MFVSSFVYRFVVVDCFTFVLFVSTWCRGHK